MSSRKTDKKAAKKKAAKKRAARKQAPTKPPELTLIEGGASALPGQRGLEGMLAGLIGGRAGGGQTDDARGQAQELMYQAWEASNLRIRLSLATKALAISADCADAYVLLAEDATGSLEEATELYRQGVAAGQRSLGQQAFEEDVGHFWGLLETRPYMRARAGLAQSLWSAGEHEEAIAHYRDMLRLNPGDNQGIRYALLACLIGRGRDAVALELQEQYPDDGMAAWTYATALLFFRQGGDTARARAALAKAMAGNPHVPGLLLGEVRMPSRQPDYIGFGDQSEAVAYVVDNLVSWQSTTGALEWLSTSARQHAPAPRRPKPRGPRPTADGAGEAARTSGTGGAEGQRARFLLRKPIYQLRILLVGIEPEIWRRVLVTGNISLGKLHDVIQIAMGWEDYHLHQFELYDGRRFCRPDVAPDLDADDERRVKLRKIVKEVGAGFCYQYDFGDDWVHRVVVETILTPQEAGRTPRCVDGKRACPPEDVGGPPRYPFYLEALKDPGHPDHHEMRGWRGAFDPEALDLDQINARLLKAFPRG